MKKNLKIYRILCSSNQSIEFGRYSNFYVKAKTARAAYNVFVNNKYMHESYILYVGFYHDNSECGIICIN